MNGDGSVATPTAPATETLGATISIIVPLLMNIYTAPDTFGA
ncbi:hypothetical protein RM530_04565 [Algiphilus sp. W345]|uniref:Uncharacterized protein n=1 Tax=Banduia mediterranea TaxID=3075609 RepID=A0ABU2WG78_9GAMM|nr:hypothetical protein [Algiphilus sp. W345]MDT0496634.1 hypothetical protein [Algiphilus sp. W345]